MMRRYGFVLALALLGALYFRWALDTSYDVVITNVRFLSGDRITPDRFNVGIRGDRITYIGKPQRSAKHAIEGFDYILAPGFLDTNVVGLIPAGQASELELLEGVTSYLSTRGRSSGDDVESGEPTVLNYATSIGLASFEDRLADSSFDVLGALEAALQAGAYGISLSPEDYRRAAGVERVRAICERFGRQGVPISFYSRRSSSSERGLERVEQAFECARAGAPVHVLDLTSNGAAHHVREALAVFERARTAALSMFFDFSLTGDSIGQTTVDVLALETSAPIGSGSAVRGAVDPRGPGSFAKFLRDYTGDGRLSLEQALYRLSTQPCERFAPYVPDLAKRGKIEVGYVADLVLWDPQSIRDNATAADALRPSSGVQAALVNGIVVIEAGHLVGEGKAKGQWMRGRLSKS